MGERENRQVVGRFWALMDAEDWDGVGALLSDDFVADWPQSGERIPGRANFLRVNRDYPGSFAITLRRLLVDGDHAATEVGIADRTGGRPPDVAVSFFALRDGRIARVTDWWPEPYPAPAWRAESVEPLPAADSPFANPSADSPTRAVPEGAPAGAGPGRGAPGEMGDDAPRAYGNAKRAGHPPTTGDP